MSSRIEKLSPDQIARFVEFRDRWTEIGLSTAEAVRPQAEGAIVEMYRAAGLVPPKKIVWCGSPLSQGLTRAIILDKTVRASVWASVWDSVYGQHDAGWLAFYRYFHDVVGLVNQTAKINGLSMLAASAGWALPHTGICWVSERHNILTRDGRGRLHNVAGPACAFPDGWAIYAWHGVRVPRLVIEAPDQITPTLIDDEPNQEIRRVMIERYGYERYVSDGTIVHEDRTGRLIKKRNAHGDEIAVVSVVNGSKEPDGTHKRYVLSVPPEMRTACEAVAWTYGMSESEYCRLMVRT